MYFTKNIFLTYIWAIRWNLNLKIIISELLALAENWMFFFYTHLIPW